MRIITRTVLILSIISLFADIASEMLYPVIPLYLDKIGFTVLGMGFIEGLANFTAGISKGYFGKLSDERGIASSICEMGLLIKFYFQTNDGIIDLSRLDNFLPERWIDWEKE